MTRVPLPQQMPSQFRWGGVPFYWYEDPVIRMEQMETTCGGWNTVDPDTFLIRAMKDHPMRTRNIADAKVFLVTIPLGTSWYIADWHKRQSSNRPPRCGGHSGHRERVIPALRRLVASEPWIKTRGKNHLMVVHDYAIMEWSETFKQVVPDDPERGEWSSR